MKYWVAFKLRLPNIARGVCDVPINNPAQADTFPTGGLWCDGRWNSPSQMSRLGSSPREREILQNVENISNQFWSHAVAKIDRHVETVWDFSLAEIAGLEDRAGLGYLGRKQPVWGGGLAAVKEGTASYSTGLTSVLTQPPLEHFHNQPAPTFIERLKNNSGWIFMFFADSDVNARLAFCQQEWDNVACRWLQNPSWLVVGDKETKMLEAHKYPHQPSPARELLAS